MIDIRRRVRAVLPLLACSALAACAGDLVADAMPATVRDSAGIAIVETARDAWAGDAEAWRVDSAPTLTIGVLDGEAPYLLSRVEGATRLPDGTIVVADRGSNQLRFFDSTGVFVRAAGREGRGPGEFEYLHELYRCGADSLFALDLGGHVRVFTADGRYVRSQTLHQPGSERSPYQLTCAPGGQYVITGWGDDSQGPPLGFYRSMTPVWIVDAAGTELASLGEHLGSERLGRMTGNGPHPFGRATTMAAGPDAVYLGDGAHFEVRRYDLDGRLARIQRAPAESLTISPAMIEAYRTWTLAGATGNQLIRWRNDLDTMPMPESHPAFTRLVLDAGGNLWAERFRVPGDTSAARWGVFAPDGVFLGHVAMPHRFRLYEIGDSYVLGVARDADDVEQVRLHALRR